MGTASPGEPPALWQVYLALLTIVMVPGALLLVAIRLAWAWYS